MKRISLLFVLAAIFVTGFASFPVARWVKANLVDKSPIWDTSKRQSWPEGFTQTEIKSTHDGTLQSAYQYSSDGDELRPLLVSLHTWGGDFLQHDPLAEFVKSLNWNYIRPNFRGPNRTPESCASPSALADIDDAISWCIEHQNVDPDRVFVVGVSGGGHVACAHFLNARHPVKGTYAWVPITDIYAWYHQGRSRGNKYPDDILQVLDVPAIDKGKASDRSPLFMIDHSSQSGLHIFAGIHDGYSGSVPIDHSLLFWNRLCRDRGMESDSIDSTEMVRLLSKSAARTGDFLGDRAVYLSRENSIGSITIFEGGHEMLPDVCVELLREASNEK
jgi:pimeloyl-ACP methyl ester carboxylesterase